MKIIVSEDNKFYKWANKLKDKKFREQSDEYLIEGFRGVTDTPDKYIKFILASESAQVDGLKADKIFRVSDRLMDKLSLTESSSGIVAVALKKEEVDFEQNHILYLDRIRDPGNMGTIIRTAVAAGYEVVCDDCVDVYNPKVVRSCVSALSKAKLHIGNFIDILKEKGYNIIGAALGGKNIFNKCDKPKKLCLVIGNEANGIKKEIIDKCDFICSIPMENMESLNASVCAGILMYYFKF